MKGLKQLVEEAMGTTPEPALPPVEVSDEARTALAKKMREWSGWPDSTIKFGLPEVSPYAQCDHNTRTFTANVDTLILNPNRVLLTVTPFRLKQEAVLTGCLLHESGHARHSHWRPRTVEQAEAFVHGSTSVHEGEPVNNQTCKLAVLMEEPRVEGLMARDADRVGASGLGWTMRAASAHLAPLTNLSVNPDQRIMDLITSWALRAAKQTAIAHWSAGTYHLPQWVQDFTSLMHGVLVEHLSGVDDDDPQRTAHKVIDQLLLMAVCVDDRGTYMVDSARDILDMLFPETDGDDEGAAQPGEGCTAAPGGAGKPSPSEEGDDGEGDEEGDEEGEGGEGNTEPEDEGSGDEPGAGDTGEDDADPSDKGGETDEKGDESPEESEPEVSDQSDTDEPSQESDPGGTQGTEVDSDSDSDLAQALRALELDSKDQTEDEAEEEAQRQGGQTGGEGGNGTDDGWRNPTKEEREIQHGAEKFLRVMIEPSERSHVTFTDTPSSSIDGAAYEAWRASGKIRAPHFFKQTRRTVEPSPPVKIAILADVSGSMDELQKPVAVLSYSLAAAALDLRNFAGRGQQIESCLIHWGSHARVIQGVNQPVPGIKEFDCTEGTSALAEAFALVEEQLPGFFDTPETPVNRLIVNFTDWELNSWSKDPVGDYISRMLAGGVNMLSVVPRGYSVRRSNLPDFLAKAKVQRGHASIVKYNPDYPGQVWDTAAELLDGGTPAPFSGF